MFWKYLIKVSEGEILRQYLKHICLLLLFSFSRKMSLTFINELSKLMKEKYLYYI